MIFQFKDNRIELESMYIILSIVTKQTLNFLYNLIKLMIFYDSIVFRFSNNILSFTAVKTYFVLLVSVAQVSWS